MFVTYFLSLRNHFVAISSFPLTVTPQFFPCLRQVKQSGRGSLFFCKSNEVSVAIPPSPVIARASKKPVAIASLQACHGDL